MLHLNVSKLRQNKSLTHVILSEHLGWYPTKVSFFSPNLLNIMIKEFFQCNDKLFIRVLHFLII